MKTVTVAGDRAPCATRIHGRLGRFITASAMAAVFIAWGGGGWAQTNTLTLELEGLTVSPTEPNLDDWINLLAFGDGSVRGPVAPPELGGAKSTPPQFQDILVSKEFDKSSPKLMEACAKGKHFPTAVLQFVRPPVPGTKSDDGPYLTITLKEVFITSYSFAGGSDGVPLDTTGLNFKSYSLAYTDQRVGAVCRATYDLRSGDSFFSAGPAGQSPPVIHPVPTAFGQAGLVLPVVVGVADADSPLENLVLQAETDQVSLLPPEGISVEGTGASRSVKLTPAAGVSGVAPIQLTLTDGSSTTSTSFLAVFSPVDGPRASLIDSKIPEHSPAGTPIGQLQFDPAPAPDAPAPFLLDSAAGRFRLEGDSLVVNDPILLDFETSPRPVVVVGVPDPAGGPASYSRLIIEVQNVAEGPYDAWRNEKFRPEQLLDPALSAPDADPDLDGKKNLIEYAFGLPPLDGTDPGTGPRLGEITIGDETFLTVVYRRRSESSDPDLLVIPRVSPDLETWGEGDTHFAEVSETAVGPDMVEITIRCLVPKSAGVRQLIRFDVAR